MSEVRLHGNSRLTVDQVIKLRQSYEEGCPHCGKPYSLKELGKEYGISAVAVYRIVKGKAYPRVG